MKWAKGPPPRCDGGVVILIVMDESAARDKGLEYYGEPVAVQCWPTKLKTTIGARRIDYDEVIRWRPL